jgi:serine/threonine protein kinase
VVALAAAVAVWFCQRRRNLCFAGAKKRKKESDLKKPLLVSKDGRNGSDEFDSSALMQLRSVAQFHPHAQVGRPANAAAEQLCAHQWRVGAVGSVCELTLADIAASTDSFSEQNKLGRGGSCEVFIGNVFGLEVAVKKLSENATALDDKQFASEMRVLSTVLHTNVCRLLAFSTDGGFKTIVLELCTGGALDGRLACAATSKDMLQWQHRLHIIVDIAEALAHLHSLSPPILHRDVKTANVSVCCVCIWRFLSSYYQVLLNAHGQAKVADFGTASNGAAAGGAETTLTHNITANVMGTRGYMPFEYITQKHVSVKTDSYAFGIVLLELLTGMPPSDIATKYSLEGKRAPPNMICPPSPPPRLHCFSALRPACRS